MGICAQSVLACATLASQGHADVELPTGQTRPCSNYFVTVAESGERKSSADAEALWPIRTHERKLREEFEVLHPICLNANEAHLKARERILKNRKEFADVE